jgi:hypothetical protein
MLALVLHGGPIAVSGTAIKSLPGPHECREDRDRSRALSGKAQMRFDPAAAVPANRPANAPRARRCLLQRFKCPPRQAQIAEAQTLPAPQIAGIEFRQLLEVLGGILKPPGRQKRIGRLEPGEAIAGVGIHCFLERVNRSGRFSEF